MSWQRMLVLYVALLVSSCGPGQPPADVVVRNGTIYTANELAPRAEALAITGDRIVFVGSEVGVGNYNRSGHTGDRS